MIRSLSSNIDDWFSPPKLDQYPTNHLYRIFNKFIGISFTYLAVLLSEASELPVTDFVIVEFIFPVVPLFKD